MKRTVSAVCIGMLLACTQTSVKETAVLYSDSWFSCKAHLGCVAVFDAFCRWTAVNKNSVLEYEAWARREVTSAGKVHVARIRSLHRARQVVRKGGASIHSA